MTIKSSAFAEAAWRAPLQPVSLAEKELASWELPGVVRRAFPVFNN